MASSDRIDQDGPMAFSEILGTKIHKVTFQEAVLEVLRLIEEPQFSFTVTSNVDHMMKLRKDPDFRSVYDVADLVVADGVPLLWAARLLRNPLPERVNGTDLMLSLSEAAADRGHSIFLLGGAEDSALETAQMLQRNFPRLNIAGVSVPPMGFHERQHTNDQIIREIQSTRPDLLFVALGAPKQETWIAEYGASTGAHHAIGVGASFSFLSGQIRRAPRWMQRAGFEWAWRLLHEPRRLARRYLIECPPFFALILGDLWKRRRIR